MRRTFIFSQQHLRKATLINWTSVLTALCNEELPQNEMQVQVSQRRPKSHRPRNPFLEV